MATDFDALSYWETRHAKFAGDYRNVGNKTLTSQQNLEMIVTKATIVTHRLGLHGVITGAAVLDAGCGAGAFAGLLNQAGFEVTGIDGSSSAISQAAGTGKGRYLVSPLSQYSTQERFDAVLCLDVLYHVLEEQEWRRSIEALCACTAPKGVLLIVENFDLENAAPHVKWRSLSDYRVALTQLGFQVVEHSTVRYPHEGIDKDILVARRPQRWNLRDVWKSMRR